ncbi:MAG: radical SAM protein [Thermoguttaceae bacterium]|jgi:radical SAM superfamily enzyme YgiQ (UPF0313 family)
MSDGFPIVRTADRTLTANYSLLFDGMLAASQTTTAPPAFFSRLLMPRGGRSGLRARVAPLGLRRTEAALLAGGFSAEDVAVVSEDRLDRAIGSSTRIIGISSGEPAGLGMNSSTMTSIAGGRIYPQAMFLRLIKKIHRLNKGISAKIVLGGPGAWQLSDNPSKRKELGIDHVVTGYVEETVAAFFRKLMQKDILPEVLSGDWNHTGSIPPIRGASTMGVVEISRGCGLGCPFCTIARVPMIHLPPQTILADVGTNIAAGFKNIAVLSEDFFRYGAEGLKTDPETLISLIQNIRRIPEVRLIQIDHANVVSIAQYDDQQLKTLHDLLVGRDTKRSVWVNVGVETASDKLLKEIGAAGKMNRDGSTWSEFTAGQLRRLCRAGFFPMASLMIGLPGESDEHIRETLDWVQSLSSERMSIFPVLYAPVDGGPPPDPRMLQPLHWALIKACYRLNFRWVPWIYADNQAAAGVPMARRALLQLLGRGQMLQWKMLFAWHSWRAGR